MTSMSSISGRQTSSGRNSTTCERKLTGTLPLSRLRSLGFGMRSPQKRSLSASGAPRLTPLRSRARPATGCFYLPRGGDRLKAAVFLAFWRSRWSPAPPTRLFFPEQWVSSSHSVWRASAKSSCHTGVTPGRSMATVRKRGDRWQVQVRRQGFSPTSRTFQLRADALTWARQMEAQADRLELPAD